MKADRSRLGGWQPGQICDVYMGVSRGFIRVKVYERWCREQFPDGREGPPEVINPDMVAKPPDGDRP